VPNGVILPPYEDPKEYEWRMFQGKAVWARGYGNGIAEDYCKRLGLHVLLAGAKVINIITGMPFEKNNKGQIIDDFKHLYLTFENNE
jgi:hypothetical protein